MHNDIISMLKLKKGDIVVMTRGWVRIQFGVGCGGTRVNQANGYECFPPSTHQNDLDLDS